MSRLDLLLVNAPSRLGVYGALSELAAIEPPVWAGLIARHCLNRGFSVQILDAEAEGLSIREAARRILGAQPRLVVFTVYGQQPSASTQCMPAASALAREVRQAAELKSELSEVSVQAPPMLALGAHPSALPSETLAEGAFDFVCQGEGPDTIATMLEWIGLKKAFQPTRGLWYKAGGVPMMFGPSQNIQDLDRELPDQAWELLDMARYRAHNWHLWAGDPAGGYASVQTSLGCPFACSFCMINAPFTTGGERRSIRFWSPANVANQIELLVHRHGITNIKLPDEMFCLNQRHVLGICDLLIERGLGEALNMWAYARVDTVKDPQLLARMRRAGFRWLGIGVESGSKHVRDGVAKGKFGNEQIIEAVARVRAEGLAVGANYIFGLPDDTEESMAETLALACDLNTEWANFYCAMAYPGSPLHAEAVRRGWRLPESPGGPGWIGYSQHARESLPLPTETMTAQQVLDFRDDAFLTYFSRPEYKAMIARTFGARALEQVERMLAFGRPARAHRGAA